MQVAALVAALAAGGVLVVRAFAGSESRPGSLLIFYYWSPATINGAETVEAAAAEFGRYDHVVLGEGLESPDHPGHAETVSIIGMLGRTTVWGYVNLGASVENLPLPEVRARVEAWSRAGAGGIFYDAAGADFGVTPERVDAAVGYAHDLGMPVILNAWDPADVAPHLGDGDYYFSESFVVKEGRIDPAWRDKAERVASLDLDVLAVTTSDPTDTFDPAGWAAAVQAASEFGYEAVGWGQYVFAADDGVAPWRAPPAGEGEALP
jgi:hypothetical protein